MTKPLASIIMTTYNQPRHLELALAGLLIQTEKNFELHIADDGSHAETSDIVERYMERAPFSMVYSWQQDLGYRKTKILNEAIRKSKADYFIFIDGDCIPHADFIRNHLRYRQKGYYLAGRRVELGPEFSERLTSEMVLRGDLNRPNLGLIASCLKKDSGYWHRSIPVYNPFLRKILKMERVDDLKGCNFSVDRESLFKINGFDEDYQGYAREDTDLELRLQYLGLKIKSLKGLAIQYHVWHERLSESEGNKTKLRELTTSTSPTCRNGLKKLS
ncbi:MAG: glycosyltransferase family 2 protein [Deltaproteobacteria bacterium]|nr:glycosyltransferase family 2 protein [Deltaproteobacteria bacterium]